MRILLLFTLIIILSNCTTVELAKEVTKASKSIKTSVDNMVKNLENTDNEEIVEEIIDDKKIIKQEMANLEIEKKAKQEIIKEQKKKSEINFLGKTFDEIKLVIGDPKLTRIDGNSKTMRFDNNYCRLFLFSSAKKNTTKVEYFEIRNSLGKLIINKEEMKKCYQTFKLI